MVDTLMRKFIAAIAMAASAAFFVPAYAQMGLIEDERLLGNDSGALGQVQQITVGGGLGFDGSGQIEISDAELVCLSGLTSAADKLPYFTGSGTCDLADFTAFGRSILDDANEAAFKATVNLEIGTDVQAHADVLDDLDTLGTVASDGQIIVGTGAGAFAYESGATARASLGVVIGTDVQAWDSDLDTYAGITPSANVQSLLAAANYAAMRGLLDLEAGTDFYSISGADAAFQPLDSDLTAIAALTTTAAGLTSLEFADPNEDRPMIWDDDTNTVVPGSTSNIATEASPAAGDFLMLIDADDVLKKVNWDDLPSGGGGGGGKDPGEFFWWTASTSCPSGSLIANGAEVSRATYSNLWSAVSGVAVATGSKDDADYSTGDLSTTFELMDMTNQYAWVVAAGSTPATYGTPVESAAPDIDGTFGQILTDNASGDVSGAFSRSGGGIGKATVGGNYYDPDITFAASNNEPTYSDSVSEISVPSIPMTPCIAY